MNFTVYLPDGIGREVRKAKNGGFALPLSRLLQRAVVEELERRRAVEQTLTALQTYELDLEDNEGRAYVGRITGRMIAETQDAQVFLTEDERVFVYDESGPRYWQSEDPEGDLRGVLDTDGYMEALNALGLRPTIDL